MNWKKYITDPRTGRPHRGAISRIAELLGTHYGTVRRMFLGIWNPSEREAGALRYIVKQKMSIAPKKRSDAGQKRAAYRKRVAVKSGAVRPQVKALRSAKNTALKLN